MYHLLDCDDSVEYYYDGMRVNLKNKFHKGDKILIDNVFYDVDSDGNAARRSLMIFGELSEAEGELFKEMFETYFEIADIEMTLKKYPEFTSKNFGKLIEHAYMHNAINEKQKNILWQLYIDGVSKKNLINNKICSLEEMDRAYRQLEFEAQYCYGIVNDATIHRIGQFNSGSINLRYDVDEFVKHIGLSADYLKSIAMKVITEFVIDRDEQKLCIMVIDKFFNKNDIQCADLSRFSSIADSINKQLFIAKKDIYYKEAQHLIDKGILQFKHVNTYAAIKGLKSDRFRSVFRRLGYKLYSDHRERSERLKAFLESDD